MKILAFSDIHCDSNMASKIVTACKDADILIGAGDFSLHGQGTSDVIGFFKEVSIPIILVPGNHDDFYELCKLCDNLKDGYFLHGEGASFQDFSFFGLGGEIPRLNNAFWNRSLSEEEAEVLLKKCKECDVLITHTPPFGHLDTEEDGIHDGSKAILTAIKRIQPTLNFCGHMHYSWGGTSNIGKTTVKNLGPTLNWFEL